MTANEGTRREKRGRQLSMPTVIRLSEWGMRFLLTAVLAGAELMGGHSLFALSLVAVCAPGAEGRVVRWPDYTTVRGGLQVGRAVRPGRPFWRSGTARSPAAPW